MHCPKCKHGESRVLDSQPNPKDGGVIRRRRECKVCGLRYTTREIHEEQYLLLGLYMDHETLSSKITEMLQRVTDRCKSSK